MDIKRLAEQLGGKACGENQYMCKCPSHDDRTSSLSMSSDDGKLLVHCHAGCDPVTILKTLRGMNLVALEGRKKSSSKNENRIIAKVYSYRGRGGDEIFQKVRYEPKGFALRHWQGDKWHYSIKDCPKVLYNLPEIIESSKRDTLIVVCEGEKDCDNLNSLGLDIVATCNFDGAGGKGKWKEEYSETLKDRRVIVMVDNDEAGELHGKEVVKSLKRWVKSLGLVEFKDLPDKGDVSDFIELDRGTAAARVVKKLQECIKIDLVQADEESEYITPRGKERAEYQDYIDLIYSLKKIADIKRCALTDELMVLGKEHREWDYAANWLGYIKSHAERYGDFFKLLMFEYHLERHRIDDKRRELRISIPQWDGRDLLRSQLNVFRFANYSQQEAYEIIRMWGAGIFLRLANPHYQNFCLIVQGVQHCGKDSVIESWTEGLGDYKKDLDISGNLDEAKKGLHTALVWNISEFDKTARVDQASLKDIITRPETDVRLAYDRRVAKRKVRGSFIASCNQKNVFADETGNRRFIMLEALDLGLEIEDFGGGKAIGTGNVVNEYPGLWCRDRKDEERLQILAYFKHCADNGIYKASEETLSRTRKDMSERTPQSMEDMVCAAWESLAGAKGDWDKVDVDGVRMFTSEEAKVELQEIVRRFGITEKKVRMMLADKYRVAVGKNKTRYYRALPKNNDGLDGLIRNDEGDEEVRHAKWF